MKSIKVRQYDVELDENKLPKLALLKEFDYCHDEKEEFDSVDVAKMLCNCFGLADKAEEYIYAAAYTWAGDLLGVFEMTHGSAFRSRVGIREIMQRMWLVGAGGFVLCHNHPSGDTSPSEEDIETCKNVVRLSEIFETRCFDFVIVGRSFDEGSVRVYSFVQEGRLRAEPIDKPRPEII